jgi:methionine-rich copper-binding protein CopC
VGGSAGPTANEDSMEATRKFSVLLSVAVLLLTAAPASAHTEVTGSNPGEGASVSKAPSEVWVEFGAGGMTMPLSISDGELDVIDPCGKRMDRGETELSVTSDRLTTASGGVRKGTYTIKWTVTALDGANQAGKIKFKVTSGKSCGKAKPKHPHKHH